MKTFLLLLTFVLLVPTATNAAPASFAGTWKTERRCKPYTVILTQVGDKVSGTFSPGNGKIFDGVVTDNKLFFKWTEDGAEGFGEFIMNWDGVGFTGTSSTVKSDGGSVVVWRTSTPPATPFAGTWQTILMMNGRNEISLTMEQSGDHVRGLYPGNGRLEGTVTGQVLRFKWQSDRGTGSGRFVMEEKNYSFSGTYNRGSNPDDVDSTWSGRSPLSADARVPGPCEPLGVVYAYPKPPRPETDERGRPLSDAEIAKRRAEFEESQKNARASFAGIWRAKAGERYFKMTLRQTGPEVTGTFVNSPDPAGVITEGIVDGNTLRFKVTRGGKTLPNGLTSPVEYMGSVELVIDEGGKTFKGTIFGTAASGTRTVP